MTGITALTEVRRQGTSLDSSNTEDIQTQSKDQKITFSFHATTQISARVCQQNIYAEQRFDLPRVNRQKHQQENAHQH